MSLVMWLTCSWSATSRRPSRTSAPEYLVGLASRSVLNPSSLSRANWRSVLDLLEPSTCLVIGAKELLGAGLSSEGLSELFNRRSPYGVLAITRRGWPDPLVVRLCRGASASGLFLGLWTRWVPATPSRSAWHGRWVMPGPPRSPFGSRPGSLLERAQIDDARGTACRPVGGPRAADLMALTFFSLPPSAWRCRRVAD